MNTGKYIFAQVIDFIPRYQFDKLVKKYKGNWHAKELSCYNQLLQLLFGQITSCDSLRDICMCLEAHSGILYHLEIRKHVTHSSLSRANENRDYRIFEELGMYLIGIVRPMYSSTKVAEITIDNVLYALDSTTISTSIVLAAWALGKYSKGAVKMHTLLDVRGSIPANIHITDGKWHDSNELDNIVPEPLAFYMMDKAYVDLLALYRFHKAGAYWISRPKDNMRYEVTDHRHDFDPSTGICGDFNIRLTTFRSKKLYPETIRMVTYHDSEMDNDIVFITNNFEISALEVANLYRHRWDIEVFFYDKYIIMLSKVRSVPDNQRLVRLLLTSTSHNINQCPRFLSQSRRSLLFSHSLSEVRFGTRSAYAFSSDSRFAFESALA